ncbi:MAG: PD40 domain-containing protein, partial [Acidobacteria bacterium]|nr:PD40 domain-containing protein [Acidobacteriota bacterium]
GWLLAGRSPARERAAPRHLSAVFPHELVVRGGLVAPDGSALLLSAARRDDPRREAAIYRRDLSQEKLVLLPGTADVRGFLVTPDAREIVFVQPTPTDPSARRVLRMPIDGSRPPVEIAPWDHAWTDFGLDADGEPFGIVGRTRLERVGAEGGTSAPVPIDVGREGLFSVGSSPPLPEGRGLLATMESWTGRGYQMSVARVDPATGRGEILIEDGGSAFFVPPDRLLFSRGSTLLAVRFELGSGEVLGRPVALAEGLRIEEAWEAARFSVSGEGTLAYAAGGLVGAERRFAILDPESGALEPWSAERRAFRYVSPSVSSDGRAVYAQLANAAGTYEIWRVPREGPAQPIVALSEADAQSPVPSPDGRWIAFTRMARQPTDGIYVAPVDRSAPPRLLLALGDAERVVYPQSWTPDSRHLVAFQRAEGDLSTLEIAVETPGVSRLLLPPQSWSAVVSPDGRQLAFVSDASGRAEVYVTDYPGNSGVGERVPVSRDGGQAPVWSPDGRTLYFNGRGTEIFAATIGADGRPAGEPRVVADREALAAPEEFGVLPDGRLLLLQRGPREGEIDRFDVVLHFDRILEERLP